MLKPLQPKHGLWLGVLTFMIVLYRLTNGLTQLIYNDEVHFWPTVRLFTAQAWPTRALLTTYGELSTPLPFMLFSWAESLLHRGLWSARLVNFLGGTALLFLFLRTGRQRPLVSLVAVLGVLINPYFYITTLYAYTDCLMTGLVLLGILWYRQQRRWLSALAFGLAICGRQYLVAFPAGILIWDGLADLRTWRRNWFPAAVDLLARLLPYGLACAVLLGWLLFWGDWGPPAEVTKQHIPTRQWHPEFGLYGLACVAVYFVLPAEVSNRLVRGISLPNPIPTGGLLAAAALTGLLCAVILIQPASYQFPYSMGPLERVLIGVLPAGSAGVIGRQAIYAALILCTVRRLTRAGLPTVWLILHGVIWSKAHIGWDKYSYPLVLAYWFLLLFPPGNQATPPLAITHDGHEPFPSSSRQETVPNRR